MLELSHLHQKYGGGITLRKIVTYVLKCVAIVAVGTAAMGFMHGLYDGVVGNENKTKLDASQNL